MYAVAQSSYVYIYDQTGMELHVLKKHIDPQFIQFLPYHFLLASVGYTGVLRYQDTSTGSLVAEIRTKLGSPTALAQNPWNAVLHAGSKKGVVSLWAPNMEEPLVKILAHKNKITSIGIDRSGTYMVTTGLDRQLKIWDIRKFQEIDSYLTPRVVNSLDISHTGLIAASATSRVTIWKDAFRTKQQEAYMTHSNQHIIDRVRFCPFEDILGIGHAEGFSSIIIPGAGEANFDALENNPYETTAQRREREVRALLDKIQPEMISLDPDIIGKIDRTAVGLKERQAIDRAAPPERKVVSKVEKAREQAEEQAAIREKKIEGMPAVLSRFVE